jgi:hypothetical protein
MTTVLAKGSMFAIEVTKEIKPCRRKRTKPRLIVKKNLNFSFLNSEEARLNLIGIVHLTFAVQYTDKAQLKKSFQKLFQSVRF